MRKVNIRAYIRKNKRGSGKKYSRIRRHNRQIKSRISKKKRKIFTTMAKQPFEVGGQLDFEKGELENVKMHFGKKAELEFDWDPDYETSFHTHPPFEGTTIMPSYEDIKSMKDTKEKEGLILHKNIGLSIAEEKKFARINRKTIRRISNALQNDFEKGMSDRALYRKYKPIFRHKLGLQMKWHGADKDIKLESRSV